ncbi:hypothetical protein SRHO_G00009130 [Serrasalmus rhombeus]
MGPHAEMTYTGVLFVRAVATVCRLQGAVNPVPQCIAKKRRNSLLEHAGAECSYKTEYKTNWIKEAELLFRGPPLGSLGAVADFLSGSGHQVFAGMIQQGLVLLMATGALISAAVGINTHLQQNPLVENISQPYEEFCSSGRCTYLIPNAFLKHLKNKQCEAAWHATVGGSLADPSEPTKLQYPVVEVTPESLVTKKHVDGLWIEIRCHDTKANLRQYRAVFRAKNTVSSTISAVAETSLSLKNSAQPRNLTVSCIMLSAGGAVLVLVVLVLCVI